MNPTLQAIIALAAVAIAVGWLVWRAFVRHGRPGCGSSGCACTTGGLKIAPRRRPTAGPPPNK